jgi:dihydroorotate dehydrogenase
MAPVEVIEGLEAWLAEQGCRSVREVVGALEI